MRRVLLHLCGVPIYSYPAMLYLGVVLGTYFELYAANSIGLSIPKTLAATLILLATALFGARLLHVLANWRLYCRDPKRMLQCSDGGASMYGGLLLALPASIPLLIILDLPFGTFWDLASLAMLVGMIVTRAGCFLNGCCAGRPTSQWWGMNLPDYKGVWQRRAPVQILEALSGMIVLVGAIVLWGGLAFAGALFLYAVGAYGACRALLETAREEQDRICGINLHRFISAGLIAASLGTFVIVWWHTGEIGP